MTSKALPTAFLLAATAIAQNPPTSPATLPTFQSQAVPTSTPFGTPPIRWQLWWSAAEWRNAVGRPVRVTGVDFLTPVGGQAGRTIQLEVRMANSHAQFPTGSFQGNFVSGETLVFPAAVGAPRTFQTGTTAPNAFSLQIPFANEFLWDGQSGVVLELRIFDNGNNGLPYRYDLSLESPIVGSPFVTLYNDNGDPNALSANFFLSRGPRARVHFADGITLDFGAGCPGAGIVVPVASTTNGPPRPANTQWTHVLSSAPSQRTAFWMFGDSREELTVGVPLPFSLDILGAPNCELLVKPDLTWSTTTVGGGAGAGTASLRTPVPPVTSIIGISFFTQWLVIDPLALNGVLTVSNGQWHVIGP